MFAHPLIQFGFRLFFVWTILSVVHRVAGLFGVVSILILLSSFALVAWMLQNRREELSRVYQVAPLRLFIDWVAKLCRCQPPVECSRGRDRQQQRKLNRSGDFAELMERLSTNVVAHRRVTCELVLHLQNGILLRQNNEHANHSRPLGSYLLVGGEGIGKRRIARIVGRALYGAKHVAEFDLAQSGNPLESLIGTPNQSGSICRVVRQSPYCVLIFDHVEAAHPDVQQALSQMIRGGAIDDPSTQKRHSLAHALVFSLVQYGNTRDDDQIEPLGKDAEQRRRRVVAALEARDVVPRNVIEVHDQIHRLDSLGPLQNAEVILQLMRAECRQYDRVLQHVSPHVLASLVAEINPQNGLSGIGARISRLMREPILCAVKRDQPRITVSDTSVEKHVVAVACEHETNAKPRLEDSKLCQR